MPLFLSALPVVSVILALALGARSIHAAWLGVAMAVLGVLTAFPVANGGAVLALWAPVLVEVVLIVGGGPGGLSAAIRLKQLAAEKGGEAIKNMAGLGDLNTFSRFLVSGVLYSVGVGVVCVAMPALLGLSRQDVRELVARFRKSRQKSA